MRNRGRKWERDQRPIPWRTMSKLGSLSHRSAGTKAVKEMGAKQKQKLTGDHENLLKDFVLKDFVFGLERWFSG